MTSGDVELQLELIKQLGAVLVAVTVAAGSILVTLTNRTRQHAKAAREQVENSHKTNLRDEADERHGENVSRLQVLERGVLHLQSSVSRIEDHLGIEHTMPKPPGKRK